jgi:hypothetical protein
MKYEMSDNFFENKDSDEKRNKKDRPYRAKLSDKGITIDYLKEDIEKSLPHLARELNTPEGNSKFSLNEYLEKINDVSEEEPEDIPEEDFNEDEDNEECNYNVNDGISKENMDNSDEENNEKDSSSSNDMNSNKPHIKEDMNQYKELSPEELKVLKTSMKSGVKSQYNEDSELYFPKTEDFLRRCSSLKEAEEIIAFQLKQKHITEEKADELIKLCKEKGIQSFGSKKEWGYYERTYRNRIEKIDQENELDEK